MHPQPMPGQGWQQQPPMPQYNGGMGMPQQQQQPPPPGPNNLSNQMALMSLGQQQGQQFGAQPPPPQMGGQQMGPPKPGMGMPPMPPMPSASLPPPMQQQQGQPQGQRMMPPPGGNLPPPPANGQMNGNSNYPTPTPPPPVQQQQPPPPGQQQQMPPQAQPPMMHPQQPPQMNAMPPQPSMMPPMGQPQPQGQSLPPHQQPSLPGMPHMPPPINSQQQQQYNGPPTAMPGAPMQQQQQHPQMPMRPPGGPGMPPMPGQQPHGMPPMPGGMPPAPGMQQRPQYPGQQPPQPQYGQQPGYGQPGGFPQQQPGQPMPGGYPPQPQAPPQQRLDPEQMPNPVQMIQDNQEAFRGPFVTAQPGRVPPLVTTRYVTQDQGNSGPRFIRSSMYSVPTTSEVMKQVAVPLAVVISPMARTVPGEIDPPIVDFGEMGPVRCNRCKAYMSPHMQFIDGGRRFQCLLCKQTTEVPAEYFQHLDHTGQRVDKYQRPELVLGTYEFVATKDYCRNNKPPKPPALIFVLDVSYNNVKSGFVHLMCQRMKEILRELPKDQGHTRSYMKVGFITYNNTVHFYNCKSTLAQPQMMIVGDLQEMFMPLLDGFLVDPEESATVIDALMEQIPAMFAESRETETILLPALQAGLEALKASETVGKLLVFHSSLPIAEAPGKLKNREDRKLLGTDKEKTILQPQCTTYNNLGQDCVQSGVSVDLFLMNNSYIDIATIGQICRMTGGEVYKYTYFQADIDGQRLVADVIKNVSRPIAFDTVMRVRTSTGIRPTDFYGHFFMSNTTDMEIASIDCDKSVAIEIKHDDKLSDEVIHIQVALLYTSCSGQRRLRILNLALNTCTMVADMFRGCDLEALVLFFGKQSVFKIMDSTPKAYKDAMIQRLAHILAAYRKHCAAPAAAGQLILPESLKLLPLYCACLLKCDAIGGGSDMACDDRSFNIHFVMTMDLPSAVSYFYPRLIPVHDVQPEETEVPDMIRCTAEKLAENGAYILENGVYMFLWLGLSLAPEFVQSVFGVYRTHEVDTERQGLPVLDNPLSKRVRGVVEKIQEQKSRCMRLMVVKQRDKLENVMRNFLVEDRGMNGAAGYVDFLVHIHKEIRNVSS